jgi:hypothetical protein
MGKVMLLIELSSVIAIYKQTRGIFKHMGTVLEAMQRSSQTCQVVSQFGFVSFTFLTDLQERLKERQYLPEKQYTYNRDTNGPNLANIAYKRNDLISSLPPIVFKQSRIKEGITTEQFSVDVEK